MNNGATPLYMAANMDPTEFMAALLGMEGGAHLIATEMDHTDTDQLAEEEGMLLESAGSTAANGQPAACNSYKRIGVLSAKCKHCGRSKADH